MKLKQVGVLAGTFATGFLVALLVRFDNDSDLPSARRSAGAVAANNSNQDVSALHAEYERQIEDLKSQLSAFQLQAQAGSRSLTPAQAEEMERFRRGMALRLADASRQKEDGAIASVGLSRDRFEWIKIRTDELQVEYRQKEDRLRQQGKLDVDEANAHRYDTDIGLRDELGDEEYTRYRQALGRTSGLKVSSTLAGGIGEGAGIQPGDEILSYNGARVYSVGQLNPLMRQYTTSTTPNTVEVLRNGQTIRLAAAGGDLRIRAASPWGNMESATAAAMETFKLLGTTSSKEQGAK